MFLIREPVELMRIFVRDIVRIIQHRYMAITKVFFEKIALRFIHWIFIFHRENHNRSCVLHSFGFL